MLVYTTLPCSRLDAVANKQINRFICMQMLGYTCIAEFFTSKKSRALGYLSFLSESFEGDTNALQAFLGEASSHDHCS